LFHANVAKEEMWDYLIEGVKNKHPIVGTVNSTTLTKADSEPEEIK
jgi:hypothetical protein